MLGVMANIMGCLWRDVVDDICVIYIYPIAKMKLSKHLNFG